MTPNKIYYDRVDGHRLRLLELRNEGKALFNDMDASVETNVLCDISDVDVTPRHILPRDPIVIPEFMTAPILVGLRVA